VTQGDPHRPRGAARGQLPLPRPRPGGGAARGRAVLVLGLLVFPAASHAINVPLPADGVTLNVGVQLQTQLLANENGNANGTGWSADVFARRTRLLVNGNVGENFAYLLQLDNANFGKYGNYGGRAIVQDAWVGWAPTGANGSNVVFVDAGILLIPISHHLLESTTNFITADVHTDSFRLTGNQFPGLRETGVQLRGWVADKRIGFRGGVYEGTRAFNVAGANRASLPQLAGFVNYDIIGSEEGNWLYGAYRWSPAPVLSVGVSGLYQSHAVKDASLPASAQSFTNQKLASADLYLDLPIAGDSELVFETTGYSSGNGTASADTGKGFFADVGYRWRWLAPYASYEYFAADDCPRAAAAEQCLSGRSGQPHAADSRNAKVGVNYFFDKNRNHLNVELGINHGQSAYGPQSITAAAAGYVPKGINTLLSTPAQRSVLMHWNVIF
jgi:hypothetical protein